MVESIFETDNKNLSALINSKALLQNLSYKLDNDKNSVEFFKTLVFNIENYDNLERMEKYYFEKDFKAMFKTLSLFYRGLQSDDYIKKQSSECLIKSCNVFPDYIGERIAIQISHLPIMELFYEDLKYQEFIKKFVSNEPCMGQTMKEYQEERLFGDGLLSVRFPDDGDLIDYDLRNRLIKKLEEEYNNGREDEIKSAINALCSIYNSSKGLKATKLQIGATYWDEKVSLTSKNADKFKAAFMALSNSFEKTSNEKLTKLAAILKDEFESIVANKIQDIAITKQDNKDRGYSIAFTVENKMSDDNIKELLKVFILKKDYECTNLTLLENENNKKFVIGCKVDL